MIALDDNQNIYRSGQPEEPGHQGSGQGAQTQLRLPQHHRDHPLAQRFMSESGKETEKETTKQIELFPDYFDYHGPQPEIKQFTDTKAIVDYVATRIKALVDEGMPSPRSPSSTPSKSPTRT